MAVFVFLMHRPYVKRLALLVEYLILIPTFASYISKSIFFFDIVRKEIYVTSILVQLYLDSRQYIIYVGHFDTL